MLLSCDSEPNRRTERLIEVLARDHAAEAAERHLSPDDDHTAVVGKLVSPCGTIRVLPQNTHIADGQSPSHLVPGKLNMQQLDPPDLQATTAVQKDEWFV